MERCAPWRNVAPSRTTATRLPRGFRIIPLASVIALTVLGCDPLSDPQDSVRWSLVPQSLNLTVGQKQQIGLVAAASTATWSSDNPAIVSVSRTGLASAYVPGSAHIVTRNHGRADTILIVVRAAVRAVHMASDSTPLAVGGAMGLAFRALDPTGAEISNLHGTTIRWTSRNPDVASVDSAGLVRAKSIGGTEIVLSIDGFRDSTLVRVTAAASAGTPFDPGTPSTQPPKPPSTPNPPATPPATASVSVTLDSATLLAGHTAGAHAAAKDSKGNALAGKTAIWSSLNTFVATVSSTGVVTGRAAGTATIQGAVDGVSGTASITVTTPSSTVPPPTPPPSNSPDALPEPTFDGTQATMLYQQTFDAYTLDSLRPACGTAPTGRIIDHAVPYCNATTTWKYDGNVTLGAGHSGQAAQWHYDGVYQETHGVFLPGLSSGASTGQKGTVVQYWAKFTSDVAGALTSADPNGTGNALLQFKNVMLWHNNGTRFQIDMHNGGCSPYGYSPTYTVLEMMDQADQACNGRQPLGPYLKDFGDGNWHRWTIYYKQNTAPGSRDAVARLWIDGALIMRVEAGACGVTPSGGWKPWCDLSDVDAIYSGADGVGGLEWGANRTDQSGIKFTMAIDDVKWWVMK